MGRGMDALLLPKWSRTVISVFAAACTTNVLSHAHVLQPSPALDSDLQASNDASDTPFVAPPRPGWMGEIPEEVTRKLEPITKGGPRVTLVNFAANGGNVDNFAGNAGAAPPADYLAAQQHLRDTWRASGFDSAQLWQLQDLVADPIYLRFKDQMRVLNETAFFGPNCSYISGAEREECQAVPRSPYGQGFAHRPFCAAVKPVALWRAMMDSREDDWVVWADASRYYNGTSFGADVHSVIRKLDSAGPAWKSIQHKSDWQPAYPCNGSLTDAPRKRVEGVFGVLQDQPPPELGGGMRPVRANLLPNEAGVHQLNSSSALNTFEAFAELRPPPVASFPRLQSTNIILRNTQATRLMVWDWLMMAVQKPDGFCSEYLGQDQTALAMLVANRSWPTVRVCACEGGRRQLFGSEWENCEGVMKGIDFAYAALAKGHFDVWDLS